MGLDMYLTKRVYVRNWDHMSPNERTTVTVTRGGKAIPGLDTARSAISLNRLAIGEKPMLFINGSLTISRWATMIAKNIMLIVSSCRNYSVQ